MDERREQSPELHPMATTPDTDESHSISSQASAKRGKYSLANFDLPKPKKKVVTTFFGTVGAPLLWLTMYIARVTSSRSSRLICPESGVKNQL